MKWKYTKPAKIGDMRIIYVFLFLPRCIDGTCRWLEFATIEQEYSKILRFNGWKDLYFIN